ncbi:abc transporter [Cordyceps javanica]|nr:abc transporter [Cordyceps javanica]
MEMNHQKMYSNDGVLPDAHWLNVLIMLYQRGLPQMVMAVISVIVLGFQLLRQPRRMPGNVLKQKPKSSILVESIGLILNVLTLSLFIAAGNNLAMNNIGLAYVTLLQLIRAIGPDGNRQALRYHIDAMLVGMFGLILAAEGLPLMIIAREYSVGRPIIRAAASLCCSVGFVVLAPHEWIAQADDFLEHASEPTYEETCSWIDYCLTYSWARGLVRGANGIITIDQLDQLPSAYSPELLRRKFSDVRKTQPTTTCALLSLLRTQLLLCTTLGVFLATAQLISPMGLHRLLEYMQHPDEAVFQPWLWVAIICGGRIVQTALQQAYSSYSRKLVAQVSAMLTAEVYQSALASRELHGDFLSADNIQSKEEPQSTASGILENLISSDIQNITQLHDVLICVTAIPAAAAAVVGLYQLVGWPCLVGIILALSGSPFESWVMEYVGNHEEQLKTAQDLRISLASEYLRSIKIIKYFGWEESAAKNIARARATEQKHVTAIDIFSTALSLIADFFPILSLVTIFGLHVSVRKMPLTASTAYMTIQLLEIVKDCLVFLALVSVDFSKAMVSLRRLDKFFKSLTPLDTYPNRPAEIQNATFQRAAGAAFYLRDINIKFIQGGLNVVTGDSGSGKSSLLLALLGETVKKSGSVTRQQDTAYAPQTVWLQAGTIQDNILFHNTYNETRYRNVVDACRLDVDFAEMQHGDQTVIGDGGFAFSGGQRARVALARTLFSRASLLLLDDIFSALDTRTSFELWNGVFCSNLVQNRTVILVTQHAWVAHEANMTIVMDNGRVQSVAEKKGHVCKPKTIQSNVNVNKEHPDQIHTSLSAGKDADVGETVELVAGQERSKVGTAGPLLVFTYLMYFGGPLFATLTVATCFFHTGAGIYTNYWMSRWVEHSGDSGSSTSYFLMRYIGLSYLTEAIDGVRMMAFSKGISVAANKLHMDMINALMAAPLSWFSEQAISTVLNSLSGDMSTLDQSIYHSIVPVISDIIKCMLMMGAVASKLPIFILPALALLVLGCLIARMHEGVSHLLTELVSSSRSPVLSAFSEGLTGSMVIRATSSTSAIFHAKMNRLLCASSRAQHAQSNASQWLKFRMSILATVINVLAASLVLSQSGKMSAGFAGFCLSQATQLSDKVLALIFSFNNLSVVMQTFQRVQEYAQLAPEKDCVTKSSEYVPASWPKTGAVELRNVTVRYNPNGQDILKNISLRIEPGSRVAIVGRTGSGKSTLISSLLGFTKVVSGQILYDGVDLQAIPYKRLRHCISTIPQEAQLFQGTLASNLDPSETVPESELQDALDVCQRILRSADEAGATATGLADSTTNSAFTERLTLSTMVKTKGENFSHGQRQVLSLCRVLIRRSKLVLLDEATSSMDARTDAGVQEALRTELSRAGSENRVLVTVAHRLQTIMDYDMVVVMGLGRILEVGSPNDLMAKKSTFYDMVMHVGEK